MEIVSRYFKQVIFKVGERRWEMINPPFGSKPPRIKNNYGWWPYFKLSTDMYFHFIKRVLWSETWLSINYLTWLYWGCRWYLYHILGADRTFSGIQGNEATTPTRMCLLLWILIWGSHMCYLIGKNLFMIASMATCLCPMGWKSRMVSSIYEMLDIHADMESYTI
jgi:hypothetical protein